MDFFSTFISHRYHQHTHRHHHHCQYTIIAGSQASGFIVHCVLLCFVSCIVASFVPLFVSLFPLLNIMSVNRARIGPGSIDSADVELGFT